LSEYKIRSLKSKHDLIVDICLVIRQRLTHLPAEESDPLQMIPVSSFNTAGSSQLI